MKLPDRSKVLSFGLVYGCGPKFVGIAVLDEIVAIYSIFSRLLAGKLFLNNQHWIEKALLVYFLFITFIGFLNTQNANALRYFFIVIFLLFYSPRKTINIDSMIVGAKAFLISYFVIVFIGHIFNLPVAFWQDSLWVGTAYAAIFSLFSAWLCILFARNVINSLLVFFIYLSTAILADSRLQIILIVAFVPAIFYSFQRKYSGKMNLKKAIATSILFIATSLLVTFTVQLLGDSDENIFRSVESTFLDLAVNNVDDRDTDRRDSLNAALNWAEDNPSKFVFGVGILAHQVEMAKYYPQSSDGLVRPPGFSAMIIDGGMIFSVLILLNAFVTFVRVIRTRTTMPVKLSAILVLALVLASIMVVNPFDAILFWLIIIPSGVLPFVLRELVHKFNLSVHIK